ncbi:MAG: hypothetical protein V1929_07525 [bacterium]
MKRFARGTEQFGQTTGLDFLPFQRNKVAAKVVEHLAPSAIELVVLAAEFLEVTFLVLELLLPFLEALEFLQRRRGLFVGLLAVPGHAGQVQLADCARGRLVGSHPLAERFDRFIGRAHLDALRRVALADQVIVEEICVGHVVFLSFDRASGA